LALAAILPGFVAGQDPGGHTVVAGNTLWGIAQQYYGDPFQWPRIYEANQDRIDNPHRIFPGWLIRIPGAGAQVGTMDVRVQPGPPGDPVPPGGEPLPGVPTFPQEPPPRTVFFRERQLEVEDVTAARGLWDVPPDQFFSAPWLIPPGTVPERSGAVESLAGGEDFRMERTTARPFDRLHVRLDGPPPAVGSHLQAFRVERSIDDVGDVVRPSGILRVEGIEPAGVVAVVESQFERILVGDLVRSLPTYTPLPVDATVPTTEGTEATILGFARDQEIQTVGDFAFMDAGSNEGVSIGDEYVVVLDESPDWGTAVEGRAKVVSVLVNVSTARIVHLENPVFVPGVRLRPDRRVR
jgi:hypothetical protein